MPESDLTFTKEEALKIQEYVSSKPEFKKNFTMIVNAWRLQKVSTKNAVKLIKEEIEKT